MQLKKTEAHLMDIPQADWDKLYSFIPIFENREFSSNAIAQFLELMYNLDIVVGLDWQRWREGKEILIRRRDNFSGLDRITLIKLLTLIVRAARFFEGFLETKFADGTVVDILKSIKEYNESRLLSKI